MTKDFSQEIMRHLSEQHYQPKKVRQLARALGVEDADYQTFRSDVDALRHAGRVIMGAKNAVMLPQMTDRIVGVYRSNPRGFGFVTPSDPDSHEDLYIPEGQSLDAITGDTVAAKLFRGQGPGGRPVTRGRIVEVVARGHSRFVGSITRIQDRFVVLPDGNQFTDPVIVSDLTAKNARPDDKVVVELTRYPAANRPAEGVIVEVLGPRGKPGVDTLGVIRQFNLPDVFPAGALDQAGRAARSFEPADHQADRLDLRDELIITIDPATARDFDDAISLDRTADGWRLGVHIADVSSFVPVGSDLDKEAHQRGTSVYLPDRVIPMLPEALSNGVCSLQEGQDRLVKTAFITYDRHGQVKREEFHNSVIRSRCRLSYEQAQAAIDGRPDASLPDEVVELLGRMNQLARTLFERRYRAGMLHLDLPKVELVLDESGQVVDARPEDDSFSHTIIEMFMVEANEAVARLLDRLTVPFIRRIHPEPPAEDARQLAAFARLCGHSLPKKLDRFAMQRLLAAVKGRPESFAINMALLRSLEQAVYSPKDEGHFALASRHYCHFTSPIRRYPDLHIHRLLDDYLDGKLAAKAGKRRGGQAPSGPLAALGKHCSFTERRAEKAERELREIKVLELLSQHVGDHLQGVVNGVAHVGLFVQCSRYMIDGLIRFKDLADDYWELDRRAGSVVGMRSGKRIQLGDLVEVQILEVNLPRRELCLRLVRDIGRKASMADLSASVPTPAPPRPAPRAAKPARKKKAAARRRSQDPSRRDGRW